MSFLDRLYARFLRAFIRYLDVTECIFSRSGNHRYLRELRQEREMLQAQLDRLNVRALAQ